MLETYDEDVVLYEPTFGMDDFGKPRVFKGWEAVANTMIMVLFGKPGFYPSIPDLGMYIQQYRNKRMDEIDTEDLKIALVQQCSLLGDFVYTGNITVEKKEINGIGTIIFSVPMDEIAKGNILLIGVQGIEDSIIYNYQLIDVNSIMS